MCYFAKTAIKQTTKITFFFDIYDFRAIFRQKMCYYSLSALFCFVGQLKRRIPMKAKRFLILIFNLLIIFGLQASIPQKTDKLVNDYAGVVPSTQKEAMEIRLDSLSRQTGNQIVVLVVTTLDGYEISDYALQIGREWGVGQKDNNNGLVMVVKVKNETKGQAYIATGYGLEGALPDATCKHIVDNEMIPHFKNNDYAGGIEAALDVIVPIVKGEYTSEEYEKKNDDWGAGLITMLVIFGIVIVLVVLDKFGLFGPGGGTTYGSGGTYTGTRYYGGSSYYGSSGGGFGGFGGGSFGGGGAGGSW